MMTRKTYRQIAEAVSLTYPGEPMDGNDLVLNQWFGMVNKLCRMFKDDNARFDAERFVQACNTGGTDHDGRATFLNPGEHMGGSSCGNVQ